MSGQSQEQKDEWETKLISSIEELNIAAENQEGWKYFWKAGMSSLTILPSSQDWNGFNRKAKHIQLY